MFGKEKVLTQEVIIKEKIIIECNKKYFRPSEVNFLLGKPLKAKKILGWKPKTNISQLIDEMVTEDLKSLSE